MDIEARRVARVLERNPASEKRPGAGWRGGLRGIAFDGERLFLAARDELFAFTPELEPLGTWRSPYLRQCQGIAVFQRRLFMVSAGYDSVLGFDLDQMRFSLGLHMAAAGDDYRAMPFDPAGVKGPQLVNRLQLNSVFCDESGMYISGERSNGMLVYSGSRISRFATLPHGVQDARPWRDGVLFNDVEAGVVRYVTPDRNHVFRAPRHPASVHATGGPPVLLRGLCALDENVIAAGSSPATITLHDVAAMETTFAINLSDDPRTAIYGLALWPVNSGSGY